MRSIKEYLGKTLLCRVNLDGIFVSGKISFSEQGIRVKLADFEKFIYLDTEKPIKLQLEDGQYCTAKAFLISSGQQGGAAGGTSFFEFGVTQAIVGFRPWSDDDLIAEAYFDLSDTNSLFEAPDIKKEIERSKTDLAPKGTVIEASSGGVTVSISYRLNLAWWSERYRADGLFVCVKFSQPKSTREFSEFLALLHTFLTMAAGIEVRTSNYAVIPSKDHEAPLIGGGTFPDYFSLAWSKFAAPVEITEKLRPTSVLRCFSPEDRVTTEKCLKFWIRNWSEWKLAFSGLFLATCAGNSFDGDRILNACKWLDSTPGAKAKNLNIDEKLDEVVRVAKTRAAELGLDMGKRIEGAIKQLRTISRNQLLKDLVNVALPDANDTMKKSFLTDVHKAYQIRGKFAHSKFEHENVDEFGDYVRCTRAVEALAFLLLYRSLPLPSDHFWGHGPDNFIEYLTLL